MDILQMRQFANGQSANGQFAIRIFANTSQYLDIYEMIHKNNIGG